MLKQLLGYRYGGAATAAVVVTGLTYSAGGQATVNVDDWPPLSEINLKIGNYNGQTFTLGPNLTIEVNDGGRVMDVGRSNPITPFSFADSTINVNYGGQFGTFKTILSDVDLNLYGGGSAYGVSIHGAGTINVLGGELKSALNVSGGAVVQMSSGRINTSWGGLTGGLVQVSGGILGPNFNVNPSGVLSVTGGQIDEAFKAHAGSVVTFTGGEFRLNNIAIPDLDAGLPTNAVFTGTMADGSVFIIGERASEVIDPETLTLVSAPLIPADTTPQIVSSGVVSGGLRAGQVLTLNDGGGLGGHFAVVGATLDINGGSVGENLEMAYSTVNIAGGQIGGLIHASDDHVSVFSGTQLNASGGRFGDQLQLHSGSSTDVSGGDYERGIYALDGSSLTFYGGDYQINGSPVTDLHGGLPAGGVFTGTLADDTVFIFSNQAVASGASSDSYFATNTTTLTLAPLGIPDQTPIVLSNGLGPKGLRPTQTLTLTGDGRLGRNFSAVGATLNIEDGTVGDLARIAYSQVNLSGGTIEGAISFYDGGILEMTGGEIVQELQAQAGSQITISDGDIGLISSWIGGQVTVLGGTVTTVVSFGGDISFEGGSATWASVHPGGAMTISGGVVASSVNVTRGTLHITGGAIGDHLYGNLDSVINISGGIVGDDFQVVNGSVVDVTGGEIGTMFHVGGDSVADISGGIFGPEFTASSGSEVNLYVLELLLGGTPVGLVEGVPFTIVDRDGVQLTAILADGSSFDLTLNQDSLSGQDYVDSLATLTATLVPEPASLALLVAGGGVLLGRRK